MSRTGLLVGVDVATADVRAVAVDAHGRVVASAAVPLPTPVRPQPGWAEQAPAHADVALRVLARLTDALDGAAITALSVTSTSGTVLPTDEAGRPTGNALLYNDSRAFADPTGAALARAGAPALARTAWLHEHTPAARYLHTSDTVLAALAGQVLPTDTSHALKTGADVRTATWRHDLLSAAGLDAGLLPEIGRPGTVTGRLGAAAASATGLPDGLPLVLGMTDGCAGQVAAGAVRFGDAVGVLGTTLVLKVVTDHEVASPDGTVYSHLAPDGAWWAGGASNVGAGVLRADRPGVTNEELAQLDEKAAAHGPARAARYPLTRSGERFPFSSAEAADLWVSETDDEVDAYRATLEGVAFTERLGFETLASLGAAVSDTVRAVGGGSRSRAWLQIRASTLRRTLLVPAEPSSAFGAAVLAASATVHDGLLDAVRQMVRVVDEMTPDPREADALDASYQRLTSALHSRGWLDPKEVTAWTATR
jgi:sugar (pentulose or hexulose) kinase